MKRIYVDAGMNPPEICYVIDGETHVEAHSETTVNRAEYHAIIEGLFALGRTGYRGLAVVLSDSQLVVRQLTGQYQTRDARLKELQAIVRSDAAAQFEWIPREENEAGKILERRKNEAKLARSHSRDTDLAGSDRLGSK